MNCPKCGEYNPNGTLFCGNCRCSLSGYAETTPKDKISYYTEGTMFYSDGQYDKALAYFLKSVELGYDGAYCDIGDIYNYGKGVAVDYYEAAKWYQKAIDENAATGDTYEKLATMYRYGKGVDANIDKAINLYEWAIKLHKHSYEFYKPSSSMRDIAMKAAEALGRIYETAPDGIKSYNSALQYYEQAVDLGSEDVAICEQLGLAYAKGIGRPIDYKKAAHFLRIAINHTSANGEVYYLAADLYHHGKGVDENDSIAKMYYRKAVERGYKQAEAGYNEIVAIQQKRKAALDATLAKLDANKPDEKEEWRRRLTRTCPRCGRNSGHPIGEFEKKASIGFWGFGSRLWGKSYKCDCCDYRW